jgi:hypothetical protein
LFGWNVRLLTFELQYGSEKLVRDQGRHVVRRALGTWLSLLTVRAILAQVKPGRRRAVNTAISTTHPSPAA